MANTSEAKSSRTGSHSSGTTDYVSIAIAYAEDAIADTKRRRYGKWIRLAAKRFLKDLKRAQKKRPPFVWSPERANHSCEWISQLPHVEGHWGGDNLIVLQPAQVFALCQMFGFRRCDGARRYSTVLYAMARKGAKSTFAAAIALYVLACEAEIGPKLYSAATTGDQARKVWDAAKGMVNKCPDLREAYGIEAFSNSIVRYENEGNFRPINAKASTQDGHNPSAVIFDELHAHKTHDLFNVLRSAAGSRKNPLFLYTTTEGYENPGPWSEVRKFAQQVLEGVIEADHFLAIYYAIDDDDDDFDEKKWGKANPLLPITPSLEKLREEAIFAKHQPGALAEFRIKRLNRPAASAQGYVDFGLWRKCAGKVPLAELKGAKCWGALDLASTRDLCAWRLLWLLDDVYYTWGRFWVPREAVMQRTERGTVPYASWVTSGHLTVTEGNVADHEQIEREVLDDCSAYNPEIIRYDPWNASALVSHLTSAGLTLEPFIQGPKSYQPAFSAFDRAYASGRLRHGGDPVLQWNASNLVIRYDANMNRAPDRKRSAEKIDGMVALLMCFGCVGEEPDSYVTGELIKL